MDKLQLFAPTWILEYLIDEQSASTLLLESRDEFSESVGKEVEMVHVDVQAPSIIRSILLQCILEQESCLTYTSTTLDTNQTAGPIDFFHQFSTYRAIDMLDQVLMSSKKSIHFITTILRVDH